MRSAADDLLVEHVTGDALDLKRERDTWREVALTCLDLLHKEKRANAELRRRLYEENQSRKGARFSERPSAKATHASHSTAEKRDGFVRFSKAANRKHVSSLKHPETGHLQEVTSHLLDPAAVRA